MEPEQDEVGPINAVALARELAAGLEVEGLYVRVEAEVEAATFSAVAVDVRRLVRSLLERASAADGSPYVSARVLVEAQRVVFELPWHNDGSSTARSEREWLQTRASEARGAFEVDGLIARLSFSREADAVGVPDPTIALRRLRDDRAAQAQELSATASLLRETRRDLELQRVSHELLRASVQTATLDLQRMLAQLGGLAAAIAERDAAGAELQSELRSMLDRVVLLAQEAGPFASGDYAGSYVGPRVTTDEPDVTPSLGPAALSEARTIPPPRVADELDPDGAEIPLTRVAGR